MSDGEKTRVEKGAPRLKPLVPERTFVGDYPTWLAAVESVAPELVAMSRKRRR